MTDMKENAGMIKRRNVSEVVHETEVTANAISAIDQDLHAIENVTRRRKKENQNSQKLKSKRSLLMVSCRITKYSLVRRKKRLLNFSVKLILES